MTLYKTLYLLLIIASTRVVLAQNVDANLEFEQDENDFGVIYEADGSLSFSFKYKSTGTVPVKVNRIVAPAFRITEYTKDSVELGKTGTIKFKLNPLNRSGHFDKSVLVFTNAKTSPASLNIKGSILSGSSTAKFSYRIGSLAFKQSQINFGYVYKGDTATRLYPVINQSDETTKLKFTNVPEHTVIKAHFDSLKPHQIGIIEAIYYTGKTDKWDFSFDKISVEVNNSKKHYGRLTLAANVREDFSKLTEEEKLAKPRVSIPVKTFNFDTINKSETPEYNFLIKNTGERTLDIRAANPTCGCTAVMPLKKSIEPGDSTYIKITFDPRGYAGHNKKGVTVITNDPDNYKQLLWVIGYVEP